MPTLPLMGGCHCGDLRYQIAATPLMVYNCHCKNCQKISGGAFTTNVTITRDGFEFVQGDPGELSWTSDAGSERFGWICGACHSRIAHGWREGPTLNVRSGTLDDTSWIRPVVDLWTASAQPWVAFSEDRARVERQPDKTSDFVPYFEAFRAQGNFPE